MKGVRHITVVAAGLLWLAASGPAFAQGGVEAAAAATRGTITDLAGSWANRLHEDWIERAPGPHIGDYSGLPINDEARAYADLYQVSMQNMPERQCILYTSQYIVMGPQNLRIEPEVDPISGAIVALHMTGTVDRAPHTVWMDGRPHPSRNAPHTAGGFSTGVWQGGMIVAQTTHLKAGLVWRNGVPHSDQATITEYYARHGDLLTITMILTDPIYYEEPFIRNATFELDSQTRVLPEPCEPQVEIPRAPGEVPHYLPGENPYLREFAETFNLPLEAVRGGAATTYPEYGKKLRATYKPPAKCTVYCCGGTGLTVPNTNNAACREGDAPPPEILR
ncbi:MAG TPA: hypothetical protein VFB92_01975 [Vicinamibacterales bacterium]|nr:hypothetical protein [Vicinamibacterales bacterium]